jgi:hypothetical protein
LARASCRSYIKRRPTNEAVRPSAAIAMIAPSLSELLVNNDAGHAETATILGVPSMLKTIGAKGRRSRRDLESRNA